MILEILDDEFCVCKIKEFSGTPDVFTFVACTDNEVSVVTKVKNAPKDTVAREDGWRGFRVADTLDFSLIGVLSKIAGVLADAEISIFAVSTYNTDYVFVKKEKFERAVDALKNAGYQMK